MITIIGVLDLKSTDHMIIYDPIVMGTYILLGGLLDYKYNIKLNIFPIIDTILGDFYKLLPILGIKLFKTDRGYYVKYTKNMCSRLETGYFPKLLTDLQPIITIFCSETASNPINIIDNIYNDRFKYTKALINMGYNIEKI